MRPVFLTVPALLLALTLTSVSRAQVPAPNIAQKRPQPRLVLIDQDGSGPGGSNQMAIMALLQASQVPAFNIQVLGITMVTGNAWRDEETQHTLRMLELIGRTDIPVAQGAVFPLVRSQDETRLATPLNGQFSWLGAWGGGPTTLTETAHGIEAAKPQPSVINPAFHGPYEIPPMLEGAPHTRPLNEVTGEDAVHFLIRQVHAHPRQVTIYAAGPLTNIALALSIDPQFASLTQGIVVMGGSLNPQTDDPEFAESPRHEFNFWFDPEAAHIVLRAHWPRIDLTTVDISIKALFTDEMLAAIAKAANPAHPAAQYIAQYSQERYYMWDELAACAFLDPTLITKEKSVLMDIDLSHGPSYGNTLTWTDQLKPETDLQKVHAQLDLNLPKFQKMFVELMSVPTPQHTTIPN